MGPCSTASRCEYPSDDERSEFEYSSCGPDPIAHNPSSAEIENERYMNWLIDQLGAMETFLSKMQSDVKEIKHDFITTGGTSHLNEIHCHGIRFQLDKIREPFHVIEGFFSAWKSFNQGYPQVQGYGKYEDKVAQVEPYKVIESTY